MKFKKVYIEITNNCNLNCPFCIKNSRPIKNMTINEFEIILNKIKNYTDYLYFHVLGEPLIHPNINELIDYANKQGFKVNITTNGYLINRIKENKNIRQLNISLHSFVETENITLLKYLNNTFESIDELIKNKTYISLRLWIENKYHNEMMNFINERYKTNINLSEYNKINDYLFINPSHEFIWPDLNNNYYNEKGNCYALKDHIGILSDGTIVPCCLDSKGIINLGNIYKDNIEDVMDSNRVKDMLDGFMKKNKCEELCKHCAFLNKE